MKPFPPENTQAANVRSDGLPASTSEFACPECGRDLGHKREGPDDICQRCKHPGQGVRERRRRREYRQYLAALAVWEGEGGLLPPANPGLTLAQRGLKRCTCCGADLPLGWFRYAGHGKRRGRCRACEKPQKAKDSALRRARLYARTLGGELPEQVPLDIIARLARKQGWVCACGCGKSVMFDFHIDHRIPVKRGGRHVESNLQLLTPGCNLRKGSKMPLTLK